MNNTLKIKLILNAILLCSFSTSLLSQWAISPKSNTVDEVYAYINEDCEYVACFNTFIFNPSGEASFPPMYIRIKINDVDQIFPLTDWTSAGGIEYIDSEMGYIEGLYKSTVCVNIGFIEKCLISITSDDHTIPLDPDSEVFIPYSLELLEKLDAEGDEVLTDGNGNVVEYVPYPVCDYTSAESLFSCEIFTITEDFCGSSFSGNGCDNTEASKFSGKLKLQCKRCILANQPLGGGKNRNGNNSNIGTSNITLSPNPFIDNLTISNLNSLKSNTILVINNLGQVVKSINTNEPQLSIATHDLDTGIYFIMVQDGDSVETFKILKQ